MNGVRYLAGSDSLNARPLPVYSDEAISFLSELSAQLLQTPGVRAYPDVVSVAFWCRRANLLKRKEGCSQTENRLGRGLAFHIAPSNIPVNFAFSFFFALLSGNASIVRVPSKPFPQVELICQAIRAILPRHPEIAARTAFVSYPADEETTAVFSAMADLRIIWGGDATVSAIRRLPAKPRCVDIVFPDRYSVCVLDGKAIASLGMEELRRLAERFYNDTYLMDQNACSSPQLILWRNGVAEGKERFWSAVLAQAEEKYALQGMTAVDKYTQLCQDAIDHAEVAQVVQMGGNLLYRAQLAMLPIEEKTSLRGKGGYFYEYDFASLEELGQIVDEKYQTLTYFGLDPEEVRELVMGLRLPGIDRIVPVGSAMDIDIIWDGYDLAVMMSRVIDVR